jgi:hypothetical protein
LTEHNVNVALSPETQSTFRDGCAIAASMFSVYVLLSLVVYLSEKVRKPKLAKLAQRFPAIVASSLITLDGWLGN